jgi:hypothetical protein
MIPMGRLSTTPVPSAFVPPDELEGAATFEFGPISDYELGGKAISDPSLGNQDRPWTMTANEAGEVYFTAAENPEALFVTLPGLTELSFAFDQNMRPVLAYIQAGVPRLRWYDTVPGAYVVTDLPAGSISPRVTLDDKRQTQTALGENDVILAYIRSGNLYYRQQRDRYETEYLLGVVGSAKLIRIGMNVENRLQFLLEEIIP